MGVEGWSGGSLSDAVLLRRVTIAAKRTVATNSGTAMVAMIRRIYNSLRSQRK